MGWDAESGGTDVVDAEAEGREKADGCRRGSSEKLHNKLPRFLDESVIGSSKGKRAGVSRTSTPP